MNFNHNYKNRIYGLDIFRTIAIMIVVHFHASFMLKGSIFEGFPWIKIIDVVELFFVLSGFLIGSILIKIVEKKQFKLNFKDLHTFWKRRWIRTLPNYFLFLLVNYLFIHFRLINGDLSKFNYKFVLFIQNFKTSFEAFFWESWSLSIEEWFYILFPLSLLLTLKIFPSKKGILISIITLIIIPLLFRISKSDVDLDPHTWSLNIRKVVVMRLDVIIYGVLAAYVKYYYSNFWIKYRFIAFLIGLTTMFSLLYLHKDYNSFFMKTFYLNLTAICVMLLLPLASSIQQFKTFIGKAITHISIISYSMYLVNFLLVQFISKNFKITNPSDGLFKYVIYWLLTISISSFIYYCFEKPILNLRDK